MAGLALETGLRPADRVAAEVDPRATYLVMAALVAATAAAHWWGLRKPWPGTHAHNAQQGQAHGHEATPPFCAGEFRLLVAAMALGGFCVHAVAVNLVPLLLENGLSLRAAATVMAVGGVGQVGPPLRRGVMMAVLRVVPGSPSGSWPCPRSHSPRSIHRGSSLRSSPSPAAWRGMFTLVQVIRLVSDRW